MDKGKTMNTDEVINKYVSEFQSKYDKFAIKVEALINSILEANNIRTHSVTSRAKSATSLREKIESKKYSDPLTQITDLAGARIITYFPTDVDIILPIIEKEFKIDLKNSSDKREKINPSVFGYTSVHYIIELTPERADLAEYIMFKSMKCEIQVRTILQHAWAEIEHDIEYKSSQDIPFEIRRRFASLAGLLEIADREFESLRQDEIIVKKEIQSKIQNNNFQIPIDMDSLTFYLKKFQNADDLHPGHVSRLVNFLSELHVESIEDFHNMLSNEDLKDHYRIFDEICTASDCTIRYAYVIGKRLGMDLEELSKKIECDNLNIKLYGTWENPHTQKQST